MSDDTQPGGPPEHEHDHDRLVALFERMIAIGERRFGMKASTAIALLRAFEAREELVRQIVRGIWLAVIALLSGAIGVLLMLGARSWFIHPLQ